MHFFKLQIYETFRYLPLIGFVSPKFWIQFNLIFIEPYIMEFFFIKIKFCNTNVISL